MNEEPKKESYVNTTYFKRLCDMVDDIYERTSGAMPLRTGFVSINKNDLYRKCALALLQENIIENLGTKNEPSYVWKCAIKLQESVYHRVYLRVRDINRKYYKNKNNAKKEYVMETPKTPEEAILPATETYEKKDGAAEVLASIPDQELWDELKRRGFVIVDNILSKTIVLV